MAGQTQAGALDRRITIQRASVAASGYNEPVETWSDLAEVFAQRYDASGYEQYRALEVGAQISTRFKVRYSADTAAVTEKDRILFEGKIYSITSCRRIGRNQWIEFDAVARDDKR